LSKIIPDYDNDRERKIQSLYAKKIRAKTDIETPVGLIDLVTDESIIEIETYKNWMSSLGQLFAYGCFEKDKQKKLILFDADGNKIRAIKTICKRYDIKLIIHD
jgi:hypothetical protein